MSIIENLFNSEINRNSGGAFSIKHERKLQNEDAHYFDPNDPVSRGVFDGVGSQKGSSDTSRTLVDRLRSFSSKLRNFLNSPDLSVAQVEQRIQTWLDSIDFELDEKPFSTGVMSFSWKSAEGKQYVTFAHKGDSRAYILRDGLLTQVTEDHSLVNKEIDNLKNTSKEEKARLKEEFTNMSGPSSSNNKLLNFLYSQRNVISSYFGDRNTPSTIRTFEVGPEDLVILSSDGVGDNLLPEQIRELAIRYKGDPQRLARELVNKAKEVARSGLPRSKDDDTTAVVFSPIISEGRQERTTRREGLNFQIGDLVNVTFQGGSIGERYQVIRKDGAYTYGVESPEGLVYNGVHQSYLEKVSSTEASPNKKYIVGRKYNILRKNGDVESWLLIDFKDGQYIMADPNTRQGKAVTLDDLNRLNH